MLFFGMLRWRRDDFSYQRQDLVCQREMSMLDYRVIIVAMQQCDQVIRYIFSGIIIYSLNSGKLIALLFTELYVMVMTGSESS
jgi:hypothetical protein